MAELDLAEIDKDEYETWLDLKNIEHGKLNVKAEKYYPQSSGDTNVQMTQIWIGYLDGKVLVYCT